MDRYTFAENCLAVVFVTLALTGCTLSFQNIDTHGTATDLVEETQSATPNVSPSLTLPVNPM